jgi:hypothetical protein
MSVIKLNISDVSPGFSASDNMFQSPAIQSGGDWDGTTILLLVLVVILACLLCSISSYHVYNKYYAIPSSTEGFQSRTIDDRNREYY